MQTPLPPVKINKKQLPPSKQQHYGFPPPSKKVRTTNQLLKWLPIINTVWLIVLTILVIIQANKTTLSQNQAPPLILKSQGILSIPFNLIPNVDGRILKLPLGDLKSITNYDVCCKIKQYYVCRAVTKNIGVDAVVQIQQDGSFTADILLIHPDMTGAACKFIIKGLEN